MILTNFENNDKSYLHRFLSPILGCKFPFDAEDVITERVIFVPKLQFPKRTSNMKYWVAFLVILVVIFPVITITHSFT